MNPTLFAILAGIGVSVLGFLPLILRHPLRGAIWGAVSAVFWTFIFYKNMPSLAYPLLGWVGGAFTINLILGAISGGRAAQNSYSDSIWNWVIPVAPAVISVLLLIIMTTSGASCFRAADYAGMIGKVSERNWEEDMQPIDPKRIALVPYETAVFLADKELGEAEGGALGSQYHLDKDYMTLQRVNHHLWWVVPLDFQGYFVWLKSEGTPGYVMVDAENPRAKPKLVLGHQFKYTPGAYFGNGLKRHLWAHGYANKVLTDFSFEVDEEGKPWWVVTVYKPTIAYSGPKVLGVAIVNPETGDIQFQKLGQVAEWVDRVIPSWIVTEYINDWGTLWNGWVNSWMAKVNLRKVADGPGADTWIVYGSDGEPYWFTGITSASSSDDALVGALYTNARTGEIHYYKMAGQSEGKIADIIHNKVKFQNLYPSRLYMFNVGGRVVWFSTLIGEAGTFNGVALVDSETSELFVGTDEATAFRLFLAKNWQVDARIDPSAEDEKETVTAKVIRIGCPVIEGQTVCYLMLSSGQTLTGGGAAVPRLSLTREGDEITVTFVKNNPSDSHGLIPYGISEVSNPALEPAVQEPEMVPSVGHGVEVSM